MLSGQPHNAELKISLLKWSDPFSARRATTAQVMPPWDRPTRHHRQGRPATRSKHSSLHHREAAPEPCLVMCSPKVREARSLCSFPRRGLLDRPISKSEGTKGVSWFQSGDLELRLALLDRWNRRVSRDRTACMDGKRKPVHRFAEKGGLVRRLASLDLHDLEQARRGSLHLVKQPRRAMVQPGTLPESRYHIH